jgi:hypothetical protein
MVGHGTFTNPAKFGNDRGASFTRPRAARAKTGLTDRED